MVPLRSLRLCERKHSNNKAIQTDAFDDRSLFPLPDPDSPLEHDRSCLGRGTGLVGIDEAGRGALAGPVVAAAVTVSRSFLENPPPWTGEVRDSKLLSPASRTRLALLIREQAAGGNLRASCGRAGVEEIDGLDILGATCLAMERAVAALEMDPPVPAILVDGPRLKRLALPHRGVVKGDRRSLAIAMASILAKTERDAMMGELDAAFSVYGWSDNRGYGTASHRAAIRLHGPCSQHRQKFIRKVLG